jgi:hypothetical protein
LAHLKQSGQSISADDGALFSALDVAGPREAIVKNDTPGRCKVLQLEHLMTLEGAGLGGNGGIALSLVVVTFSRPRRNILFDVFPRAFVCTFKTYIATKKSQNYIG